MGTDAMTFWSKAMHTLFFRLETKQKTDSLLDGQQADAKNVSTTKTTLELISINGRRDKNTTKGRVNY